MKHGFFLILLLGGVFSLHAQDMDELQKRFAEEVAQLQEKKQKAVHEWEQEYLRSLLDLKSRVRDDGDLDALLAITKETERLLEERGLPEPFSSLDDLKAVQEEALGRLKRLDDVERKELRSLAVTYDQLLEALQRKRTRNDQIDQALAIREERERIAAAYPPLEGEQTASSSANAPAVQQELRIVKARYGARGTFVDVTDVLQQKVKDGSLSIQADNSIKGDPLPGVVKALEVEYRHQGKTHTVEVREGKTLELP